MNKPTQIDGRRQIKNLTITNQQIAVDAGIETTKLADSMKLRIAMLHSYDCVLDGNPEIDGNDLAYTIDGNSGFNCILDGIPCC